MGDRVVCVVTTYWLVGATPPIVFPDWLVPVVWFFVGYKRVLSPLLFVVFMPDSSDKAPLL